MDKIMSQKKVSALSDSISKVSLIPYSTNELICTNDFYESIIKKEITFSNSCPLKYYIKIQNKYQDYIYK